MWLFIPLSLFSIQAVACKNDLDGVFSKIHWKFYKQNECGKLKNCFSKLKGDSGGLTYFGIAIKSNPIFFDFIKHFKKKGKIELVGDQIEPFARVKIYRDYYKFPKIRDLHYKIRQPVFDYAVHSGVVRAVKTLQKTLNIKADGVIGKITISKSKKADLIKYHKKREAFLRAIPIYKKYKKGMEKRLKESLRQSKKAIKMYNFCIQK